MLLNRARADQIMDEHKLDGLVASFKENIYYLSDYWGPMFLMSRNFTLYAFLPRDPSAPAALIMPGSGVYHLEHRPTWMPNISTYVTRLRPGAIPPRDFESSTEEIVEDQEDFVPQGTPIMPYKTRPGAALAPRDQQLLARYDQHGSRPHKTALLALKGAIKAAGLEHGRFAFDDPRVLGWLNAVGLEDLSGVDGLNIFKAIRMVKSETDDRAVEDRRPHERDSAERGDRRHRARPPSSRHRADPRRGPWSSRAANRSGSSPISGDWRPGWWEPNELIKLDSVGSYKEYRGDVGRSVFCGQPTPEMLARSRAVSRALEIAYEAIRPGKTFKEIVDLTLATVHREGFPGFVIAGPHSVGLEHTDHPVSVGPETPGSHELVFLENMVFTLDMPYHEFGWGTTHVEDMMIVRRDGCEPITSMKTDLRVKPLKAAA